MKVKSLIILGVVIFCVVCLGEALHWRNTAIAEKEMRVRAQHNVEVLTCDIELYKTEDSLNCARVEALEFTEKEYKDLLASQAEELKRLNIKNRNLLQALDVATSTNATITTIVRDTVLLKDSVLVQAKCFDYDDDYLSLHGCVSTKFEGDIQLRDTIFITETVKYKRFLGFLWKTRKVKNRKWDIVSKNPYTNFSEFNVVKIIY